MPMVMEKTDWMNVVSGASRAADVWFEMVKPKANRISILAPRGFGGCSFQIVMIPVEDDGKSNGQRQKMSRNALRAKLRQLPQEYGDDWDGYGAKAVSKKSIATASRFAGLLPEAALAGDVCVDTEGEVYFEWRVSASKYCSVTFAEDGCFLCLVKNGRNKTLTTTNVRSEALEYVRGIFN